jgi:hypothetical protein
MSIDAPRAKRSSTAGIVFGGLSFIPGIGVLFGIVAIVIGAIRRSKTAIFLGVGGIVFSVVIYGGLFYFAFVDKTGIFSGLKIRLASQIIEQDAGQIALYRLENGQLPKTLAEMPTSRDTPFVKTDPWLKPLAYKPNDDGTFELRSAGPDGEFGTADDIAKKF